MRTNLERILGSRKIGEYLGRNFRFHYDKPLFLEGGLGGFKIRALGETPLIRLDEEHHEKPENHLQYGDGLFTGRSGNEAVEIFTDIFRANPNINLMLPPDMPKYGGGQ